MPSEPRWLPLAEVVALNRELVAETHEPHGVLKPGELESACFRALRHWEYDGEADVAALAIRLLFGIARSHAFVQGNKRTGFVAALMFLRLNGWELDPATDSDELGEMIIDVLNGGMGEEDVLRRLAPYFRPSP